MVKNFRCKVRTRWRRWLSTQPSVTIASCHLRSTYPRGLVIARAVPPPLCAADLRQRTGRCGRHLERSRGRRALGDAKWLDLAHHVGKQATLSDTLSTVCSYRVHGVAKNSPVWFGQCPARNARGSGWVADWNAAAAGHARRAQGGGCIECDGCDKMVLSHGALKKSDRQKQKSQL